MIGWLLGGVVVSCRVEQYQLGSGDVGWWLLFPGSDGSFPCSCTEASRGPVWVLGLWCWVGGHATWDRPSIQL